MSDDDKTARKCNLGNGCVNPTGAAHGCPYQEEINDSKDQEYCTCCEECMYECSMDV